MVNIQEYRRNKISKIEDLISAGGLSSYEITDKIKEICKEMPELKEWAERLSTWRDIIYNSEDTVFIDKVYGEAYKLIKSIMNEKHEKEVDKENKRHKENMDWWKEYYRKINESKQADNEWWRKYYAKEHDWQKDIQKGIEENKKRLAKENEDWVKENQNDDIDLVEAELRKTDGKVSEAALNKKLGVSDWREKINKTSDIVKSQRQRFEIEEMIRKLNREIVCDYCKETKSPTIDYDIPSKKKKFCSTDCQFAWERENKENGSTGSGGKLGISNMSEFFAWMKKMGVERIEFDFNTNQVIIKCKNNKHLGIADSGLSPRLQEELTTQLKSTSEPITFSEVSSEFNKNNKDRNAGIIGFVVIIGVILIVIIGVVIHKSKKRDY